MELGFQPYTLRFAHPWSISRNVASGGKTSSEVVFAELKGTDGLLGIGEAAPSMRYHRTPETVLGFPTSSDPSRLSFQGLETSRGELYHDAPNKFEAETA